MQLIFTGDLILDEPEPDHWLEGIASALRSADLSIGHLEVPHTTHIAASRDDVPAPGADPTHLPALARAGIGVVTLAGNHIADLGQTGIADTIDGLASAGIAYTGAGATLSEARKPAIVSRSGKRVAVLSYNCVGPESSWAGPAHAGCSYIRVTPADGGPIRPAAALEHIDPASLVTLAEDIEAARKSADVVVVAFHKGIVHTRARLAPYERPLAHAAVEAGCDVVIGHHAHIVRGIEFHRGVPIFHGLGNGCVVTRALSPDQASPERAAWARKRKELFGFEPDPAYVLVPFHPEAVNALLGRMLIDVTGRIRVGFIPVHVDPPGRPRIAPDAAERIAHYIQTIGLEAGLPSLTMQITSEGVWLNLMERDTSGQTRGPLFYVGAAGLMLAMAAEALAVLGRHVGIPLLGALEIIQACILLMASTAMLSATLNKGHATVTLVTARVSERTREYLHAFANLVSALFFVGLASGVLWLAAESWNDYEQSELLHIPFRPLRVVSLLAAVAIALVFLRDMWRSLRGHR